ncbi:MAG: ATP-grasp domain-containing protein [Bacteroidetes bacterium]|nr:ATP-grasp domain-containing protein [Bacteroidota bacterium]
MILYLEKIKTGHFSNLSFYAALEAYYNMGFEVREVESFDKLTEVEESNIFLGSIQFIHQALHKLNKPIPEPLDYPESLTPFLGRKLFASTINDIANNPSSWNVFVKPKGISKKFTGRVIRGTKDLIGCGDVNLNTPVWVSEPVEFVAEWRTFVRHKQILGVKQYKGDWKAHFDADIIEQAVGTYQDQPAGFALDFGLTKDGKLLLVEANDGYSLGNYGLFYIDYAKLLASRWAELSGQKDLCDF